MSTRPRTHKVRFEDKSVAADSLLSTTGAGDSYKSPAPVVIRIVLNYLALADLGKRPVFEEITFGEGARHYRSVRLVSAAQEVL